MIDTNIILALILIVQTAQLVSGSRAYKTARREIPRRLRRRVHRMRYPRQY